MSNKNKSQNDGLVYSTDYGRMCPECQEMIQKCRCKDNSNKVLGSGKIRIRKESKGRGGKTVTIIEGLPENASSLESYCKELKRICGSGGTVKDGNIEIQGEHGPKLLPVLQKKYKDVKLSGF